MTTLYKSPDVLIDKHEWHLRVHRNAGSHRRTRVTMQFYFRPFSSVPLAWRPVAEWRTPMPPGFGSRFQTYRLHGQKAKEQEEKRGEMLAGKRVA